MNEKRVEVISEFNVEPIFIEHVKEAICRIIAPSRSEPGCWHYDFFENSEQNNQFILIELWANQSSWNQHLQQDYIKKCYTIIQAYLIKPIETRFFNSVELHQYHQPHV